MKFWHIVDVEHDTAAEGAQAPSFEVLIADCPCLIRPIGGYESYRGRQIESGITYTVELADCPEFGRIRGTMRLQVKSGPHHAPQTLNVRYDNPVREAGRSSGRVLFCSEQVGATP